MLTIFNGFLYDTFLLPILCTGNPTTCAILQYSVDPRFNASPTRSNFSVTLRTLLLGEDHFIIKCLQYVKEPFVFVLFELFIVPFNVYI